eukprot:TRINITY_DN885_c0_g1_i3.p1 TRINITY_DN885_c0_g1~~TRINITY_DN885_c0_g1_i3.p1  ORF type:complete len:124 (+),score=36.06 TRINITY_DN885_c0_g1_i3:85-456(+)
MARTSMLVLFVLGCGALFGDAQSLKGSAAVAEVEAASGIAEAKEVKAEVIQGTQASELEAELPKQHPPTTNQALMAFCLVFLIPALGIFCMMKGKDAGWEGAFGVICCLIFLTWVYTAVVALV